MTASFLRIYVQADARKLTLKETIEFLQEQCSETHLRSIVTKDSADFDEKVLLFVVFARCSVHIIALSKHEGLTQSYWFNSGRRPRFGK